MKWNLVVGQSLTSVVLERPHKTVVFYSAQARHGSFLKTSRQFASSTILSINRVLRRSFLHGSWTLEEVLICSRSGCLVSSITDVSGPRVVFPNGFHDDTLESFLKQPILLLFLCPKSSNLIIQRFSLSVQDLHNMLGLNIRVYPPCFTPSTSALCLHCLNPGSESQFHNHQARSLVSQMYESFPPHNSDLAHIYKSSRCHPKSGHLLSQSGTHDSAQRHDCQMQCLDAHHKHDRG